MRVWLRIWADKMCRLSFQEPTHVAVKAIGIGTELQRLLADRELKVMQLLADQADANYVAKLLDTFDDPKGRHRYLVLPLLGETLNVHCRKYQVEAQERRWHFCQRR
jgi:hypothetical protein